MFVFDIHKATFDVNHGAKKFWQQYFTRNIPIYIKHVQKFGYFILIYIYT